MKKIALFISIMLVVAMMFACQPTPESEYIVNRNDGALEEIIYSTEHPSPFKTDQTKDDYPKQDSSTIQPEPNYTQADEMWEETLTIGNVTCVINAPIHFIDGPKGVYCLEKQKRKNRCFLHGRDQLKEFVKCQL